MLDSPGCSTCMPLLNLAVVHCGLDMGHRPSFPSNIESNAAVLMSVCSSWKATLVGRVSLAIHTSVSYGFGSTLFQIRTDIAKACACSESAIICDGDVGSECLPCQEAFYHVTQSSSAELR